MAAVTKIWARKRNKLAAPTSYGETKLVDTDSTHDAVLTTLTKI